MMMSEHYRVHRGVVPQRVCEQARRRLLLELRRWGVSPEDIADWSQSTWWPSLRGEDIFGLVRSYVDVRLARPGVWAETQILIRLPDEADVELGPPHLDELPPWATGLRYRAIYSVELTDTPVDGGGTVLHLDGLLFRPPLQAGDVLEMGPGVPHSGSPNKRGDIRMALIFRMMEAEA